MNVERTLVFTQRIKRQANLPVVPVQAAGFGLHVLSSIIISLSIKFGSDRIRYVKQYNYFPS